MASTNGGFDDDPLAPGSYSQLLFADDEITSLETDNTNNGCFSFTTTTFTSSHDDSSTSSSNTPKMLCFGNYATTTSNNKVVLGNGAVNTGPKSGVISMDSSTNNKAKIITTLPKSSKKRCGPGSGPVQNPGDLSGAPTGSKGRNNKKSKLDHSAAATGHAKVANKKEKLGERITALQQLVSPFGKTDTASVLHEALGYIRFLQDQVQVLCSPYMQRQPPSAPLHHPEHDSQEEKVSEKRKEDLRSRGLCLVPVELTLHVANSNGADLWSSTAMP